MDFKNHNSYKIGYKLSNILWPIVRNWDFFTQNTIGKQLIRSVDSISSNIAEGWYRYYKKEKILFYNYAKTSFYESLDWLNKANRRGLLDKNDIQIISKLIQDFPREINGLIKGTKENLEK